MNIVKLIFSSTAIVFIIILLRQFNKEYSFLTECLLGIGITFFSISSLIPVFDYLKELSLGTGVSGVLDILFKSCAICMLCEISSSLCREAGLISLSEKVEFAGKCTLIALCLPLINKVFDYAISFIN